MEIHIAIEQTNETTAVMRIQGAIDASNFVEVVDKAREIYKNPTCNLILDLSEVPSLSVAGQAAIHKIALIYSGVPQEVIAEQNPDFTHSSNARRHVKLLNPQPDVDKTLEKAGLKLFFKVYGDLESALNSF